MSRDYLVDLQRTHYGFCAWYHDVSWGGYAFIKLCGYSRTGAIRELRRRGIRCPSYAYEGGRV